MLIDWFTVCAQALNFLILVWLMKRFLYKPILHAIDAREKRIAAELADAAAKKAEAQKERDEFQHKNQEFDQRRAALLNQATDEAKVERQRLLDEARNAAAALTLKRQETLINEEHNLHDAISRRTQQEVFAIARKALTDLAGMSLEERMVDVFVRRLRELNGDAKGSLVSALKGSSGPVIIRTAFDLPPAQHAEAEGVIKETFGADTRVHFETAPAQISGIELNANGQKVAWSIADYLASLEKGVDELLNKQAKSDPSHQIKMKQAPGMNQSMEILKVPIAELQKRIDAELKENPGT
jgi:F-type H+-transporting ATPase subunit b